MSFDRVLTSGQVPDANEGAQTIAEMVKLAGDRIEIMPGSGVSAEGAAALVKATGVSQIHLRAVQ